MKPYVTSMLLDFRHGKPMEIEAIYGEPLRAAAKAGLALPQMQGFYHILQQLNGGRES